MGFQLDNVMGPGDPEPKSSKKAPANNGGFDLNAIEDTNTSSGMLPGARTGIDFSDYSFLPKTNANNALLRAQNQSGLKQAGLMLGNSAANIVTGVVEGFGYLPELFDGDRDYSNALTEKMQEWKNPLGEIYRENPDQVFDWSDPAWWYTNFQGLVESAGAFALEGAAIGKIMSGLAFGAANALRLGTAATKATMGAAELASGALLSYTEGAMSGARIYQEAYQKNYDRGVLGGLDPEAAHEGAMQIAGNAAATVVKVNTAMNTLLNVGILAPLFRTPTDETLAFFKGAGARAEGESLTAYGKRLAGLTADAIPTRHGWSSLGAESAKEALEEVNTQYAEEEGRRAAKGDRRSIMDALTDIGQYFKDVTNEEGALNALLGAFGGLAQTVLLDNIPTQRILKKDANGEYIPKTDANGETVMAGDRKQYQTKLVSTRTANEMGTRQYFEDIKDVIAKDIDTQIGLQTQLKDAYAKSNFAEVERLKGEIFAASTLDSVTKGLGQSFKNMYNEIADLDNTRDLGAALDEPIRSARESLAGLEEQLAAGEDVANDIIAQQESLKQLMEQKLSLDGVTEAMQKGYATSMQDNAYKTTAREAARDVEALTTLQENIQRKYGDAMVPEAGMLADHLFFRSADVYLRRKAIEKEEKRIIEMENMLANAGISDPLNINSAITKYNDHIGVMNDVLTSLKSDVKKLQTAIEKNDVDTMLEIAGRYKAKGVSEGNLVEAVNDLNRKLDLKIRQYNTSVKSAEDMLKISSGYLNWITNNQDKTFDDYVKAASARSMTQQDKSNLEYGKVQLEIAEQNLNELTSKAGIRAVMKALADDRKKYLDAIDARNKRDNAAQSKFVDGKRDAKVLDAKQKEQILAKLQQREADLINKIEVTNEQLQQAEYDLANKKDKLTGMNSTIALRDRIASLRNSLSVYRAELARVQAAIVERFGETVEAQGRAQEATEKDDSDFTEDEDPNEEIPTEEAMTVEERIEMEAAAAATREMEEAEEQAPVSDYSAEDLAAEFGTDDALNTYLALKDELSEPMWKLVEELEAAPGDVTFTAINNKFKRHLITGKIDQDQINRIYLALEGLKDYKAEKKAPVKYEAPIEEQAPPSTASTEVTAEIATEAPPTPEEITAQDIPEEIPSGQPEVEIHEDLFSDEAIESFRWEMGHKATSGLKVNTNVLAYTEIRRGDLLMMRTVTVDGVPQLDTKANLDTMVPGRISVGDSVTLAVDAEYQDAGNYLDAANGKVKMDDASISNVPIKIIHTKTGKVIGYFPRIDWIEETKGATNYRNIEDEIWTEDGEKMEGNVSLQRDLNFEIRKRLSLAHNRKPGSVMVSRVAQRTNGNLMFSMDVNQETGQIKYKPKLAKTQLPDPSLQFGFIAKGGAVLVGKSEQAGVPLINTRHLHMMEGSPVVLIPLPNGKYLPSSVSTTKFSKRTADLRTAVRVIEVYLQAGTAFETELGRNQAAKILDATGFDITTESGLENYIQQYYTYTTGFQDSRTQADADSVDGGAKVQKFMLNVMAKGRLQKSPIKVGTSYSGRPPVYAALDANGNLDDKFSTMFIRGMMNRFKNVTFNTPDIKGLNDSRPINTVLIDVNGTVKVTKFNNYNEYLKSFVSTPVYGGHQVGNRYVYAANSQMVLDSDLLFNDFENATEVLTENPIDAGTTSTAETDENYEDPADAYEGFTSFSKIPNIPVRKVIEPEGSELNLANLQEMYNFTEPNQRNGRKPADVLRELQDLGITKIAEGYNPFLNCS